MTNNITIPQSDTAIAWTRTSVQAFVTAALVWVAANLFDQSVDVSDPVFILVAGAAAAVIYRASLWLADKVPVLGYVLFGVNKAPGYVDSPPAADNPIVQAEPPA